MSGYRLTPQAADDLFDIWAYIADDEVEAANCVEEAVHAGCAFLVTTPRAGVVREDLTSLPLRFWLVQPYRNVWIVYDPQTTVANHPHPARSAEHPSRIEVATLNAT